MSNYIQPPVGLRPRWIWIEHRIEEISQATERYRDAIAEWAKELEWLREELYRSKRARDTEE